MRTLVLNAGFEPLAIISDRRAVVLVLGRRATILKAVGEPMRSPHGEFPRPSVILLGRYVRPAPRRPRAVSRRGVLHRDAHRCLYCGEHASTVDHVMPRSRGGESSWSNLVACCRACNHRKADRTLEEMGWKLPRTPRAPENRGWHGPWDEAAARDADWEEFLVAA